MSNIDQDAIVNEELDEVSTTAETASTVVETESPSTARDAAVAAAKELGIAKDEPVVEKKSLTAPAIALTPEKRIDPITGAEVVPMKAPASWTPVLREKWATIDPTVQKYIADRERDLATTLTKTAEERTFAKEFKDIVAPYDDMLSQHNVKATEHVSELLGISRVLNFGTPAQKAQQIHTLIMHHQPDAQVLQALFAGQRVDVQSMQPPEKKFDLDAEIDRRTQERAEQAAEANAAKAFEAFSSNPANEFAEYLREPMSKAIGDGFVSGDTVEAIIKNAYDFCVRNNSEIQSVLAGRNTNQVVVPSHTRAKPVQSVKPGLSARNSQPARANKIMSATDAAREAARELGLE